MYKEIEKIYRKRLLNQKPFVRNLDIRLNYILKYLPSNKNIFILDAGCGNGNYAFYLSNLKYKNIYAIDLFPSLNTDRFYYQQASIENLPFPDNYFDFIYSNSVIYYLEDPNRGIIELRRVLKPNGILIFTVHTKYSLFTFWRLFKRDVLKLESMEHLKGAKFYTTSYYKRLLKENSFEIILLDGYGTSFFFYPFYKKIVKGFQKFFDINLPLLKPYMNNGILGRIKSELAYHAVFIVRKIDDKN